MWATALYSIMFGIVYVSAMHEIEDSEKLADIGYRKIQGATHKPTLFLDLDGTLFYREDSTEINLNKVVFRTGLNDFLKQMSEKFELVVFTWSKKETGAPLVAEMERRMTEHMGENFKFADAFYEDDCTFVKGETRQDRAGNAVQLIYKDISHRGRELKDCILLDDDELNFYTCGRNGIRIYRCLGFEDDGLQQATSLLTKFADMSPEKRESLVADKINWVPWIVDED